MRSDLLQLASGSSTIVFEEEKDLHIITFLMFERITTIVTSFFANLLGLLFIVSRTEMLISQLATVGVTVHRSIAFFLVTNHVICQFLWPVYLS